MAKEKKNLDSLFPGIKKSVMACKFPEGTTEEQKLQIFSALVGLLKNKSICKKDGSTDPDRHKSVDYIMSILPMLDEDEIQLILEDGEQFYYKFCYAPSKQRRSLYSELERRSASNRLETLLVNNLYERYYAEFGLSPYELTDEVDVSGFVDRFQRSLEDSLKDYHDY